ncbi:MAG: hypothetical protein AB7S56_10070 [Halothiobacillaceae bacterium]
MSIMQNKIASILEQRRSRLPQVQQEIERWAQLDIEIAALKASADDLPPPQHMG